MKQFFSKLAGSLIFIVLSLIISVPTIKYLGLWSDNFFIKFFVVTIIGFLVNFFLFSYVVSKINVAWQGLFSMRYIMFICWLISFIFAALGGVTYLLMLRNGSFSVDEVVGAVSIYISVAIFFIASSIGVMKACCKQPVL